MPDLALPRRDSGCCRMHFTFWIEASMAKPARCGGKGAIPAMPERRRLSASADARILCGRPHRMRTTMSATAQAVARRGLNAKRSGRAPERRFQSLAWKVIGGHNCSFAQLPLLLHAARPKTERHPDKQAQVCRTSFAWALNRFSSSSISRYSGQS